MLSESKEQSTDPRISIYQCIYIYIHMSHILYPRPPIYMYLLCIRVIYIYTYYYVYLLRRLGFAFRKWIAPIQTGNMNIAREQRICRSGLCIISWRHQIVERHNENAWWSNIVILMVTFLSLSVRCLFLCSRSWFPKCRCVLACNS